MFEIKVCLSRGLTDEKDLDTVLINFLSDIGYLQEIDTYDKAQELKNSIPYMLFKNCFLMHPKKEWSPEELMSELNISRPTLYRHLNKIRNMDLLETMQDGKYKRYKLRYENFSKAWVFVEANLKLAIDNYNRTVQHIQSLMEGTK